MKKTYISPAALTVQLGTTNHMLQASSLKIFKNGEQSSTPIDNPNQILTNENKDVNVWDEEW